MLVPIREPEATIISAMIREPDVSAAQWLRSYVDFCQGLPSLADSLMLAPFEEITSDMGGVIRQLNQRFATNYVEFDHTESVAKVFHLIEERSRRPPWEHLLGAFLGGRLSLDELQERVADQEPTSTPLEVPEDRVPRPSPHREANRTRVLQDYAAPRLASLRARAEVSYEVVSSFAR